MVCSRQCAIQIHVYPLSFPRYQCGAHRVPSVDKLQLYRQQYIVGTSIIGTHCNNADDADNVDVMLVKLQNDCVQLVVDTGANRR